MRRKIIGAAIVAVGLLICCVPLLLSNCTQQEFSTVISSYDNDVSNRTDTSLKEDIDAAEKYNKKLVNGVDEADENGSNYYDLLSYGSDGAIGYISVPKVGINLPIYHGTSDAVLAIGAGHMENTSLPIGGKSTHSVIVGHTGLSYAMFDGLHNLIAGDEFYITVQNKKLTYRVIDTRKVLPNDTDYTEIVPGKDLVTLVTCYPNGVNSHRLLVQGERVN
ncbi:MULTISPECIES: class C sortase [unclassified Ruminococcus]|uniref:class C sortase n=1 Tax=unclassified Ruminococcus TaxID=2608920 RepID=UPI00210EEA58|nr:MULTISPECIES: class C sortase [unclassified Ruminococcus]MCQ4021733.1 class C sortase [Ruminococcus sp. zg-924]MCQ4114177.1 class C sortase [Ruminococcus sp. zg-921]